MKFGKITVLLALGALLTTSCDFFRSVCGKPTSVDINLIRHNIAAAEQARIDSVFRSECLRKEQEAAARFSGLPQARYNLVAASFKDSLNAVSFRSQLESEGFDARLLKLRNGLQAVTIYHSEDNTEALARLREIKSDPGFKHDLCIYDAQREIDNLQQNTITQL